MNQYFKGDIVWVDNAFNEASKHIQKNRRPAVVLQNNVGNTYSPTIILAYITTKIKRQNMPTHVIIDNHFLNQKSMVLLEQIATCDKEKIICKVGKVTDEEMARIDRAAMASLGVKYEAPKKIQNNKSPFKSQSFEGEVAYYKLDKYLHIHFNAPDKGFKKEQLQMLIDELETIEDIINNKE